MQAKRPNKGPVEKRYYTTEEASIYTGIPKATLRAWRSQNPQCGPNFYKPQGRVLYDRDELDNYIRSSIHVSSVRAKQEETRNVAV